MIAGGRAFVNGADNTSEDAKGGVSSYGVPFGADCRDAFLCFPRGSISGLTWCTHLTGVEGIVLQANRIAHLIEEHFGPLGRFCLFRDRKIAHFGARDWCFLFYSRIGGNLATEIGRSSSA